MTKAQKSKNGVGAVPRAATPRPGWWWPVMVGAVALVGCLIALWVGDGVVARSLREPGVVVRWSLPLVRLVHDVAGALATGGAVLTACVVSARSAAWRRVLWVAAAGAMVWAVSAVGVMVLTFADITGQPLTSPGFGPQLSHFALSVELTRNLFLVGVLAALATTVLFLARTPVGAGWAALLCMAAWWPLAATGHAAGANHEIGVSGWWLHAVAMAVWVGGLAVVLWVRRDLAESVGEVVTRFSTLALLSYVVLCTSGVMSAFIRLNRWQDLLGGYGAVVLAKTALLVVLGVMGWWHRRNLTRAGTPSWVRFAVGEVAVMAAAVGLAVGLSRSVPPVPDQLQPGQTSAATSRVVELTGRPLPAPPSWDNALTVWTLDPLWLTVSVLAMCWYLWAVLRMRRRGDTWPWVRTLSWSVGCLTLIYLSCGSVAIYGRLLFSSHMIQHMAMAMVVPLLWVWGGPLTLALRTCTARHDGSWGPREWILWLIETPWAKIVSNAGISAVIFVGSMVAFYYTDAFELALRTHTGHVLMMVHFLIAGFMFAESMCGIDPHPHRLGFPIRLVVLFATMAFHAFFGIALISGTQVLAADWFTELAFTKDLLLDQQQGGEIAWGIGELPTLALALAVAVQWVKSDRRESVRLDRAADRNDDAELKAYNEMLAQVAKRDQE